MFMELIILLFLVHMFSLKNVVGSVLEQVENYSHKKLDKEVLMLQNCAMWPLR